jgi:hypothetical protein
MKETRHVYATGPETFGTQQAMMNLSRQQIGVTIPEP